MGFLDELEWVYKGFYEKGKLTEAKKRFARVISNGLRGEANSEELALGYVFISTVSCELGELEDVLLCCEEGLKLTEANRLRARLYLNMSYALGKQGRVEEALSVAESAIVTAEKAGIDEVLKTARKNYAELQRPID